MIKKQETFSILRKNRLAVVGMYLMLSFFLVAIVGGILTHGRSPFLNPSTVRLPDRLKPPLSRPTAEVLPQEDLPRLGIYLLGTDDLGRDIFARMLQGALVSLFVGFVAVGIAVAIGVLLGSMAGFFGERRLRLGSLQTGITVDGLIVGFIDVMLCIPTFILILTVVAILPSSIWTIMVVIGLTSWMGAARFVRAEFLALKEQDFIVAAHALGLPQHRIIFRHLLPNALTPVLVSATIGIPGAILTEAALSFLGFGVPLPHATWGNILAAGRHYMFYAPWLVYIPGMAILVTVLSFNLFGEGLRDALNPKLRER